jgi:very-short-patch-repair endonuclease
MSEPRNRILEKMLERLYASLASGPSLNCRPHHSRQRVDLSALSRLDGTPTQGLMAALLGEKAAVRLSVKTTSGKEAEDMNRREEEERQALMRKLATIAEDARTFEQDTGAHVLHVGFPLLNLPPDAKSKRPAGTRRVLAPIAFIPVSVTLKKGRAASVELEAATDGADRVMPNTALLAWVEQQTGQRFGELFADEAGQDPWRELNELVAAVAKALELPLPSPFTPDTPLSPTPRTEEASSAEAGILPSAVLGLYPLSNQSLVDDMRALVDGEPVEGPLESFLRVGVSLGEGPSREHPEASSTFRVSEERLISQADPCQARAVRLARSSRGLVVHGPPGTGKSQTIANAIGDHLARGERVLLVCDKRTALDVVKHRLEHLGLGALCAVVHDAQRDQRDLYMGIREQLDGLPEARENPSAQAELSRVDAELLSLHQELSSAEQALSERPEEGTQPSFHELAGQWLEQEAPEALGRAVECLGACRLAEALPREREVREALERALKEGYPDNPWRDVLGVVLSEYLSTPLATYRERLAAAVEAAREADALRSPDVPAFSHDGDVAAEGWARAALAERLEPVLKEADPEGLARWAEATPEELRTTRTQLESLAPQVKVLNAGPLDTELALVHRTQPRGLGTVMEWMGALGLWLPLARQWYRFLFFLRRARALQVVKRFGLAFKAESVERVARFLEGVRARTLLTEYFSPGDTQSLADDVLSRSLRTHRGLVDGLLELEQTPELASCRQAVRTALRGDAAAQARLLAGLRHSAARGDAVARAEARLEAVGLLTATWAEARSHALREGEPLLPHLLALAARLSSVEGLLRMRARVEELPPALGIATTRLALAGAQVEDGWKAVRKAVLSAELSARLREAPALQDIDTDRLHAAQARYRALEARKKVLVRDTLLHRWTVRQHERLLASTGGRLNGLGAELRRRLLLRGERAMRVRQVIATGASVEGGDPLFDLRPVWMASPQTVAQIFPRRPVFDVVIFDESSQCRLEEALPVLTRAKRVVIAGDPKQLPPTRFFESAVVQSQEDTETEDEQGLFEEQQAEVEDLLGAALNLEIDQCYLDVHYRSQNEDLIGFSNTHFYDSRLQAIPGHPSNRVEHAPLRLVPVVGVYEKRVNREEARAVGLLVKELLARPEPPSIGVACFNLSQRDTINEVLEELAAADAGFASKLAAARTRQGAGSFEGLFVKNLENVQGDERDHLIISTTYGPDAKGRFYRRFGPLGRAGGGRRLNVLVTRARQMVHLVTSIPREVYTALPPVESGKTPNGGWLLFAYLQYAERLAAEYAEQARQPEQEVRRETPVVRERETEVGSAFARALAARLARTHGVSSDVHWGNDGFCVDVALHHPRRAEDVTVGVLCDGTRYPKAADKVEWDLFRTRMLEGQGWKLVRLWTPHFFRDPEGAVENVLRVASEQIAREPLQQSVGEMRGEPARRLLN